jgi:hypothetical protein
MYEKRLEHIARSEGTFLSMTNRIIIPILSYLSTLPTDEKLQKNARDLWSRAPFFLALSARFIQEHPLLTM